MLHRNGQEALIADSGAPIKDPQGTVYGAVLVFRDVTGEKRMEDDLIRTFSKGGASVRQPMAVAELLVEATQFAMRGSNVRGAFDLVADLWPFDVDAGQLHQVIHNVVLNAVQATPAGGIVQVQAHNRHLVEEVAVPLAAGRYVRITIDEELIREMLQAMLTTLVHHTIKEGSKSPTVYTLPQAFDPLFAVRST